MIVRTEISVLSASSQPGGSDHASDHGAAAPRRAAVRRRSVVHDLADPERTLHLLVVSSRLVAQPVHVAHQHHFVSLLDGQAAALRRDHVAQLRPKAVNGTHSCVLRKDAVSDSSKCLRGGLAPQHGHDAAAAAVACRPLDAVVVNSQPGISGGLRKPPTEWYDVSELDEAGAECERLGTGIAKLMGSLPSGVTPTGFGMDARLAFEQLCTNGFPERIISYCSVPNGVQQRCQQRRPRAVLQASMSAAAPPLRRARAATAAARPPACSYRSPGCATPSLL